MTNASKLVQLVDDLYLREGEAIANLSTMTRQEQRTLLKLLAKVSKGAQT